jgi:hypothetical protein
VIGSGYCNAVDDAVQYSVLTSSVEMTEIDIWRRLSRRAGRCIVEAKGYKTRDFEEIYSKK